MGVGMCMSMRAEKSEKDLCVCACVRLCACMRVRVCLHVCVKGQILRTVSTATVPTVTA